MLRRPPRSTRTDTLVPYTTLFRSLGDRGAAVELARRAQGRARDLPSDLPAAPFEPAREIAQQSRVQPGTGEGIENGALPSDMSPLRLGEGMCQRRNLALVVQNAVVRERLQDRDQEIGRASCRERGGQDV